MNRTRRILAVFLLALAVALPAAALPAKPWENLLSVFRSGLAPVLGLFEKSRASADPDGGTPPAIPPEGQGSTASQDQDDGDSRAGADPNG